VSTDAARVARRQIHLDFHNSSHVQDIGSEFIGTEFAGTLSDASVQSVNVFAKCHHGFAYYPTKVGTTHPGLTRDLLGEQIAALHDKGIQAPVYVSIMWDDLAAERHPEWVVHDEEGRPITRMPFDHGSPLHGQRGWSTLDLASEYAHHVQSMVAELCSSYPVDGFWFDIVWPEPNYSPTGLRRARNKGVLDLTNQDEMRRLAREEMLGFMTSMSGLVRELVPSATMTYNGSIDAAAADLAPHSTQLEIESLPTSGQWGYLHYPTNVRYIRTLGLPTVGMTGRFHRSWSDFGGLKTPTQLKFEAGTILSGGSAISVGDQLHPSGRLDQAVYDTIATAYNHVADLEPWLADAEPRADIAVLSRPVPGTRGVHMTHDMSTEVKGATQLLLERHHQFDIVDPDRADLSAYRLVIVPDDIVGGAGLGSALETARLQGTSILLSCRGGWDVETGDHGSLLSPAAVGDACSTTPSYVSVGSAGRAFPELDCSYPYALYDGALILSLRQESEGLGSMRPALFDRQWDHFTGHAHAPVGLGEEGPWAAVRDNVAVSAFPVFAAYARHDYWVYKAMAGMLIDRLLPSPSLELQGPSWIEAGLLQQPATAPGSTRWVVHLTAYTPRRGTAVARVDDGATIAGLTLTLRPPTTPRRGYLAPDGPDLMLRIDGSGAVHMDLPPIPTHAVIVLE
jgi:hypothetical protein